jgi:hydroxymethylpyrimidine pyrophosphatase-like HAD family hydrolase
MALEVTPELGWDKGTAVSMMVRHLRASPYRLLYAGDSANDAAALSTTISLGGIAIGVGPNAPEVAQYSVPDTETLRGGLEDLERGLSAVTGPGDLAPAFLRQQIA